MRVRIEIALTIFLGATSYAAPPVATLDSPATRVETCRKAWRDSETPIGRWLDSGEVRASSVTLPKGKHDDPGRAENTLLFITPKASTEAIDKFVAEHGEDTIGFGFVRGWFDPEHPRRADKNDPPFHAYVRVGNKAWHYDDDGQPPHEEDYIEMQKRLQSLPRRPITYETEFALPAEARADVIRYYTDRLHESATVGKKVQKMKYSESGWGQEEDGVRLENCVTFSLSFLQTHWSKDYGKLSTIKKASSPDPNHPITIPDKFSRGDVANLFRSSNPIGVVVWDPDPSRTDHYHIADMFHYLMIKRNPDRDTDPDPAKGLNIQPVANYAP